MKKSKQKTKNRILTLSRKGNDEESVNTSDVTGNLFSDVWKEHVDGVRTSIGDLQSEKLFKISRNENPVRIDEGKGPIKMSLIKSEKKDQ